MADIRQYNGRPAIHINGEYFPPMMATIRTNNIDHMVIDREYYRQLGKAGIRLFFVIYLNVFVRYPRKQLAYYFRVSIFIF